MATYAVLVPLWSKIKVESSRCPCFMLLSTVRESKPVIITNDHQVELNLSKIFVEELLYIENVFVHLQYVQYEHFQQQDIPANSGHLCLALPGFLAGVI